MEHQKPTVPFNSVQLNIVTFVDVNKVIMTRSLENAVYMMDSAPASAQQGTPCLQTTCKQGQALNWIIYPLDANRRMDGIWPPSVKISSIVFFNEDEFTTIMDSVMSNLRIYGAPDKVRSPYTPVYYYWAGTIPIDLTPGIYHYRLILELETWKREEHIYLNLETPTLNVVQIAQKTAL
jgi:hypothetical protein